MACIILDALRTLAHSIPSEANVTVLTLLTGRKNRSEMIHDLKKLMYDRGKNQIYFCLFFSILPFLTFLFQEIKYLAM